MKKTILAILLILVSYLAFFSGSIIGSRGNVTSFDDQVIILDIPYDYYQSKIVYEQINDDYLIYNGNNPNIKYDILATDNNYIDVHIKTGASDLYIYDGATEKKALKSEPIFTCYAGNECITSLDLQQYFYIVKSESKADIRLILIKEITKEV